MTKVRLMLVAALVMAAFAAPAYAQGAPTIRSLAVSGAPVAAQLPVGVQRSVNAPTPQPAPVPFRANTRQNRTLMIFGGAAMLTGAVVGHDAGALISVGGAVVFLYGLYQYLQ